MTGPSAPVGLEAWLQALDGWATAHLVAADRVEGYSNVIWRLPLEGAPVAAAALRLEPAHGIFEPYDVLREAAVLRALAPTDVPVPRVLATEPDPGPLGARAVLMEWVDAPHLGEAGSDDLAAGFAAFLATLVAIHRVDWRAAGLDFLGAPDPEDVIAREVAIVAARMEAFGCEGDPFLERARAVLTGASPPPGHLALCHGDANVFNYLVRGGRVVAVVDWEEARISDLRYDLGQLVALTHLQGLAPFGPPSAVPVVAGYEAEAGEPLIGLEPFRALWLFHLAAIHRGLVRLTDIDPWFTRAAVDDLLARALAEL